MPKPMASKEEMERVRAKVHAKYPKMGKMHSKILDHKMSGKLGR